MSEVWKKLIRLINKVSFEETDFKQDTIDFQHPMNPDSTTIIASESPDTLRQIATVYNLEKCLLVRLPTEMILYISRFLPDATLYRLLQTCSRLYNVLLSVVWVNPPVNHPSFKLSKSDRGPFFIKQLDFSQTCRLTDGDLKEFLAKATRLQRLALPNCILLSLESILTITSSSAATNGYLRSLNLACCHQSVNDEALFHISSLPRLVNLNISGCPISDLGLSHLSKTLTLQRLSLKDCGIVTFAGVCALLDKGVRLVKLDLSRIGIMNDLALSKIAESCTQLEWLSIARSFNVIMPTLPPLPTNWSGDPFTVSDNGLIHLLERCNNLMLLDVAYSTNITSKAFKVISEKMDKLVSINFTGCIQVDAMGLKYLGELRCRKGVLQIITLGQNAMLTDQTLADMTSNGALAGWKKSVGEEAALKATRTWWNGE